MSSLRFRTQAHHLPELDLAPVGAFETAPRADESDYADVYAIEQLAAEMAAARALQPPTEPDPDGARLMAEYAADHATTEPTAAELAADEDVSAFFDAAREQFIDWLSTMSGDPHAARPGLVSVRPSTPAPAAAAQAVVS